jgi:NAD(P)H-quinone oxidoreductase subunit 4L
MITLYHYLTVSLLLFGIGLYGILTRRNAIGILMSIELVMNSANLNLVAFSKFITPQVLSGQVFALFVIAVAAGEAVIGLAIVLSIYRCRNTLDPEDINLMKW